MTPQAIQPFSRPVLEVQGLVPPSEGRALRASEPLTCDLRDWTPEPPAMLDPRLVLTARRWMLFQGGHEELYQIIERDLKCETR